MPSFDVRTQLNAFEKHVNATMKKAYMKGALSSASRIVNLITTEIIPAENPEPVDRGHYRSGFEFAPTDAGADVFNTMPRAIIIEEGARAENIKIGRLMIDALTEWVIRKGLVGKARGARAKSEQAIEARNIAWAIAVSMKKRGIFNRGGLQGLRVVEKAMVQANAILKEEVSREVKRAFRGEV